MKIDTRYIIGLLILTISWLGCEDPIPVELDESDTFHVVDAFINNNSEPQTIRLSSSQTYFENTFTEGLSGATVTVSSSSGRVFEFIEGLDGNYIWNPEVPGDSLGAVGEEFLLEVSIGNDRYTSFAQLHGSPVIDSITYEERDDLFFDGIYAEFFARDLPGLGNTYWIKSFKNGSYLNKPEEINIAFDAAFDGGSDVDNLIFIRPIRELINPFPDSDEDDSPWAIGDHLRVEIHSINFETFSFLETARDQILNGLNGIFAEPLANSPGNIINETGDLDVLGVFCVSQIQSAEIIIE